MDLLFEGGRYSHDEIFSAHFGTLIYYLGLNDNQIERLNKFSDSHFGGVFDGTFKKRSRSVNYN